MRNSYRAFALSLGDGRRHLSSSKERYQNLVCGANVRYANYPTCANFGDIPFYNRAAVEVIDGRLSAILDDGLGNWLPFDGNWPPVCRAADLPRRTDLADHALHE